MSWMCYSSLITLHPVILGIQLHHSIGNIPERAQLLMKHVIHNTYKTHVSLDFHTNTHKYNEQSHLSHYQ
jgi:hypothetical protein